MMMHENPQKIPVQVFTHAAEVSVGVAHRIADLIRKRQAEGRNCVLGLPTGSTPMGVYAELVRLHREENLSFKNVITFNLDEYYPMAPDQLQSFHHAMNEYLFDHVDILRDHIHMPDGTVPPDLVEAHCRAYEQAIKEAGGIDLQLLGIGRTGHIGFNEPGSSRSSRTRLITLDRMTRMDAASDFFGEQHVPRRAITMGVGTILEARSIILMAFGEHKAPIIAQAVEGPITSSIAASFLQEHPDAVIMLDAAAAEHLTAYKSPWLLGEVEWDERTIRKALVWLSQKVNKPILKLTDEDYNENGLQSLLASRGSAYDINIDGFRALQETITGWPGGKPDHLKRPGDIHRPTDRIFPKRVLIFSPHPDDDVISMGGTLIRLVEQQHEVHVAYQTSGNIAVFDTDAIRFMDFVVDFCRAIGMAADEVAKIEDQIEESIRSKKPGDIDTPLVQQIKAFIRRGEARAAGRECNIPVERLHFLDLPFYETGKIRKKPLGPEDIAIIRELLQKIRPHQIYAAGDLSDPHGTHRTCLSAIFRAIDQVKDEPWFADTEIWLYRGAWQEWEPHKIDMAVPLSPDELLRKRYAIFRHQSQKDKAMFPGTDEREFWQRAEARNRETAALYNALGLAEYEAMEAFVQWRPSDGHI